MIFVLNCGVGLMLKKGSRVAAHDSCYYINLLLAPPISLILETTFPDARVDDD